MGLFSDSNRRGNTDVFLAQAQKLILAGDYANAETLCKKVLTESHSGSAARDQLRVVSLLGKCYEAQHKYEAASELYMGALRLLKGSAYDDIYSSLLYVNERMGTFSKKEDGCL